MFLIFKLNIHTHFQFICNDSILIVIVVLIALQQAGSAVGWGFQLQSPGFVIALAYLFLVMGLSLSGLVQLGGNLMNAGSSLADKGGLSGSFFTGVLAIVVLAAGSMMGLMIGLVGGPLLAIGIVVTVMFGRGVASANQRVQDLKDELRVMERLIVREATTRIQSAAGDPA